MVSALLAAPGAATSSVAPAGSSELVVEAGTVSTLAGPNFCGGRAVVDRALSSVRALAIDGKTGRIHLDTGRSAEGLVAMIDPEGNATMVPTGIPGPPAPKTAVADASPPARLAPDGAGGVFMAVGKTIVRAHQDGGGAIFAGGGAAPGSGAEGDDPSTVGGGGDGDPAFSASFVAVASLASDADGNLFVAERVDRLGTFRVRLVNRGTGALTAYPGTPEAVTVAPDTIATIAGTGAGGGALGAALRGRPPAMAVAGTALYLAASTAASGRPATTAVRVVNLGGAPLSVHGVAIPPGAVATVAGGGPSGFSGDGGPARSAAFSSITGIGVDEAGSLLVADAGNHRVRKVDAAGTVTTLAGSGGTGANAGGFNGNGLPATEARLNRPSDVKAAPGGRIYISDQLNQQLRFVDQAGIIHGSRGNGVGLTWSCTKGLSPKAINGVEAVAQSGPASVAAAGTSVFFPTPHLAQVHTARTAGTVKPLAVAGKARFSNPRAVAAGTGNWLYVLDDGLEVANLGAAPLRVHGATVAPGALVKVFADAGGGSTPGAGGLLPDGVIAAGRRGEVIFADSADFFANRVRRLDATGDVSTLVGPGTPPPAPGCCRQPGGLAVDPAGNVYISSSFPPQVWFLNRGPQDVTVHGQRVPAGKAGVVAGTGTQGIAGDDGPAVEAQLLVPRGIALDRAGNLYVADTGENTIRKVDKGGVITTVAGTGTAAFNGDGLNPRLTALSSPSALATDRCGNLLIADQGNKRVRRVNFVLPCEAAPPKSAAGDGRSPLVIILGAVVAGTVLGAAVAVVVVLRRRSRSLGR